MSIERTKGCFNEFIPGLWLQSFENRAHDESVSARQSKILNNMNQSSETLKILNKSKTCTRKREGMAALGGKWVACVISLLYFLLNLKSSRLTNFVFHDNF